VPGATFIPGEVIAAAFSLLSAFVFALSVGMVRHRDRMARVEEWQRLYEQAYPLPKHDGEEPDAGSR